MLCTLHVFFSFDIITITHAKHASHSHHHTMIFVTCHLFCYMRVLEDREVKRDKREKEEKGRNICQIEIIIVSHHTP